MAQPQEALDSVAERARRALRDNDAAHLQAQAQARVEERQAPPFGSPAALIAERMRAIARVKELEPRLATSRLRANELSQRLTSTPTDSVHYAELLRWLAEVHAELRELEGEYEEAQHVIRSSAWLMKMLADPT